MGPPLMSTWSAAAMTVTGAANASAPRMWNRDPSGDSTSARRRFLPTNAGTTAPPIPATATATAATSLDATATSGAAASNLIPESARSKRPYPSNQPLPLSRPRST